MAAGLRANTRTKREVVAPSDVKSGLIKIVVSRKAALQVGTAVLLVLPCPPS